MSRNSYDLRPFASAHNSPVADHPDRACANPRIDPEIFFPMAAGSHGGKPDYRDARAVCRRCPHVDACRDWAIETRQEHGMWGMTTPDERRAIIRRNAA